MAQTVFDVGDPITSRLKLGITPDGTSTRAVTVTRPDGTVITGLTPSAWVGDETTVQWFATNDGTVGAAKDAADGDWLAVWTIGGTGASVTPKVYSVQPLPGTTDRPVWRPFLSEVADYVPWLTLDTTVPGGDTFLGTFTGNTYPTDEQVHRHISRVEEPINGRWPDLAAGTHKLARAYVAVRTAANLARAFPRTPNDLAEANSLAGEADRMWADLTQLADDSTTAPSGTGQVPIFAFPAPSVWGDQYL